MRVTELLVVGGRQQYLVMSSAGNIIDRLLVQGAGLSERRGHSRRGQLGRRGEGFLRLHESISNCRRLVTEG